MPSRDRIDQRVIALYDDFTHRHFDRRLFLEQAASLVGAGAAAVAFAALRSNYALAEQVKADDPRIETARVTYPGSAGTMQAYAARPRGSDKLPGILVIHQNRGINPHIRDVARRVALANYVAVAPDFLSPYGGTPEDDEAALQEFAKVKLSVAVADGVKSVAYLRGRSDVTARVGAVGFCWGGGLANRLAEASPELAAVVAYYGVAPPLDQVKDIKAELLLHYAGLDTRVGATRAGYETALKQAGVGYTADPMRAPTTPSTTIPPRATTRTRPRSPGGARSTSSPPRSGGERRGKPRPMMAPGGRPMGMTIAEKILARAAGVPTVAPGDIADVEVDTCVLTDMNFLPASWRQVLKLRDPDKVVVVLDHLVPANEPLSAGAHATARAFVKRFGIKRFHDVGREQGISHVVVADNAYALPGTVMVNPDSHTCGGGAYNCAARGVGLPETICAVTTGRSWFRVGET
ncbi:MAG: dienelactone hydrolase family protein, partial [Stellaceae bacterium]